MADVIIAGGGPVGMLLACELRLHGVDVVVLEKLTEPSPHSRAFRLQPRTMEMLDYRGLAERFRQGRPEWPKAHFAGLQPLLDLSRLTSSHPYSLLIPQAHTERLLEERATELGARVRRGHEVTGLAQDRDGVTVLATGPEGSYDLRSRFLVGCDGGRSTVRKLAGFDFPGTGASVTALLGDVILDDPGQLPSGVPGTTRTAQGLLMAVALEAPYVRVLTTEFRPPQDDSEVPVTLDDLRESIDRVIGTPVGIREPRWLSRFSDATRLAGRYRDGRVLLAGDAAHIHFPIGAQGLNLGLQEAMNLGWKLAAEVRGSAPEGLLDSYHDERHPVARRVLGETQAQLALMNPDARTDPLRELFGELLALAPVNAHLSGLVAGTDVGYRQEGDAHPWTGRAVPDLDLKTEDGRTRIAELLHPGRGVLLDLTDSDALSVPARKWAPRVDLVRARTLQGAGVAVDAATERAVETARETVVETATEAVVETVVEAVLIRPDGHVAWAGPADAAAPGLTDALHTWFGPPARP
ncbi:FAD-dependent monooxygenase [Streptomyces mirabilis]|uniref:FAD-dependent monooxygenase n=1 Tax=Streptomyces mirabilis TaxID=68239 RepID=UPI00331F8E5C